MLSTMTRSPLAHSPKMTSPSLASPKPRKPTKRKMFAVILDIVKIKRKSGEREDKKSGQFQFNELPIELRAHIITFVGAADLLNLSLVDRQLHELISKPNLLWKPICLAKWPCPNADDSATRSVTNWRSYFYQKMAIMAPEKSACFHWKIKDVSNNPLPSARQSLSACTLHDNKIVYIGGQTSVQTRFDDVYIYNTDTRLFTKMNVEKGSIPKFARHSAAGVGDKVFVFGGYDGIEQFFGLSVLDTVECSWSTPDMSDRPAPIPRTNHQLVSVDDQIYLFGGNDTTRVFQNEDGGQFGTFGDLWRLDTVSVQWHEIDCTGPKPCARSGHQMIVMERSIYLFGGGLWNDKRKVWSERFNDMWVLNVDTLQWREISQKSPPAHAFISLPTWRMGPFIFVFNDSLYCFDTITESWNTVRTKGTTKPQKRFLGSATFVEGKSSAYMFGGVYSSVVNCFDELTVQPPKNLISTLLKMEAAAKMEDEMVNAHLN